MTLPNFLVIGAMSSGTTSLYEYLRGHPQIFMSPVKEPAFFALEDGRVDFRGPGDGTATAAMTANSDAYRALFAGAGPEHRAVGEASAWYLLSEDAPRRIRDAIPGARLVAILRDPSERAYASFRHLIRAGREPIPDFIRALAEEDKRARDRWDWLWRYVAAGFYHRQLERYFRLFDRSQIRLFLHEDLAGNTPGVVRDVFEFLGVDPHVVVDTARRFNPSAPPRSAGLQRFLTRPNALKSIVRPLVPLSMRRRVVRSLLSANEGQARLPSGARARLVSVYREDILKLQDLIGRDLSGWLRTD